MKEHILRQPVVRVPDSKRIDLQLRWDLYVGKIEGPLGTRRNGVEIYITGIKEFDSMTHSAEPSWTEASRPREERRDLALKRILAIEQMPAAVPDCLLILLLFFLYSF